MKMMKYNIAVSCGFGMEKTVKFELKNIGINPKETTDGRIFFEGSEKDIAMANIHLRTAQRVSIVLGKFPCNTFDDLFEGIKSIDLKPYFEKDSSFPVTKARSVNSKLTSIPAIQSVAKKALADNLMGAFNTNSLDESGDEVPVNILILKNEAQILIDTSAEALNKRGYRQRSVISPVRESIAAFMVMASPWNVNRALADPMCGSGTIAIEAAMIGLNMQPGARRNFAGENYKFLDRKIWKEVKENAISMEKDEDFKIMASDIDSNAIAVAKENAKQAGVLDKIEFSVKDVADFNTDEKNGFLISNPPYGIRLDESDFDKIYASMKKSFENLQNWSYYIISTDTEIGNKIGINFQKKRKIFNGGLESYLNMYLAPKENF